MKILFWVPYPTEGPSNRYRVEQYLPHLEKQKITYTLRPFWCQGAYCYLHREGSYAKKTVYFFIGLAKRILDLFRLRDYDIVFIHREASPLGLILFERIARLLGKAIIFDFDDSIFLPNFSEANRLLNFLKNPAKVAKIIKLSDRVIAGNDFLNNYARSYNRNCVTIPTVIDTEKYTPREKVRGITSKLIIGWIGSSTTIKYLDLIKEVFHRLIEEFDNIEIHVVGGQIDFYLPHIINKEWSLEKEISDLKMFDIGIMPISEDDWGRGKCAFKIIQYMSLGIPAVASRVGMNSEIIRDGINGFLAKDNQEWFLKLSALINSAELRARLGRAGRETVEKGYSLKSHLNNFINALKI